MNSENLKDAAERYSYGGRQGGTRKAFLEGVEWQRMQFERNNKTFKCDGCGEETDSKEKFPMVDENHNIQEGLFECAKCKGL